MTFFELLLYAVTILSVIILYYIFDGYKRLLQLLVRVQGKSNNAADNDTKVYPSLSILLTVFNEQEIILQRINNLLSCDYPKDRFEIVVASDGSTDSTERLVKELAKELAKEPKHPRVRLFKKQNRLGKSDTQNQAVETIDNDIVVFTDAGSEFDPLFLKEIVKDFIDPKVGAVTGHLLFKEKASGVSRSQNFYWRYEVALKQLENRLSILAVMSGAGLAVRKKLFEPLFPDAGEDCTIPLSVIAQGYQVRYAAKAITYDMMPDEPQSELKTRIRMTQRNWTGTWRYPQLLNPFYSFKYAFAIWSHKLIRWLSPLFLISLTASSFLGSLIFGGAFYYFTVGVMLFLFLALLGWKKEHLKINSRFIDMAFSFLLANIGFLLGVLKHFRGQKSIQYK